MADREMQSIHQKLGQASLKVDAYFLKQTGFIANQTVLKLGEYNLHCVPATLGLEGGRFLAVLTPSEISLFSKFKDGTNILILTFDDVENHDVARFHLRVGLTELIPLENRKNVCFLDLRFKSLPGEFTKFLAEYLESLETRHASWEAFADEMLPFSDEMKPSWGGEPRVVLCAGEEKIALTLVEFHTKKLRLQWPEGSTWVGRPTPQLKMTVRGETLTLEGSLDSEGAFLPDFHPLWLDLVEDCRFQRSIKSRPKTGKSP